MKEHGVYVYGRDRSEHGMVEGVLDELMARNLLAMTWRSARIVLIPGDRREAVRFAMRAFEAGKEVWHLGGFDSCTGDEFHYDGTYRLFVSVMARRSGGKVLTMRDHRPCHSEDCHLVGPTMIDSMPPKESLAKPMTARYALLCWNWDGWHPEKPPLGKFGDHGVRYYAMNPGNDGPRARVTREIKEAGWTILPRMGRPKFLSWLAYAESVHGNSSLLTYEAPVYHPDEKIFHHGNRNEGRGIVRWAMGLRENQIRPSVRVAKLLAAAVSEPRMVY